MNLTPAAAPTPVTPPPGEPEPVFALGHEPGLRAHPIAVAGGHGGHPAERPSDACWPAGAARSARHRSVVGAGAGGNVAARRRPDRGNRSARCSATGSSDGLHTAAARSVYCRVPSHSPLWRVTPGQGRMGGCRGGGRTTAHAACWSGWRGGAALQAARKRLKDLEDEQVALPGRAENALRAAQRSCGERQTGSNSPLRRAHRQESRTRVIVIPDKQTKEIDYLYLC